MITFTFDLPLPPDELKPNSRSHWRQKAKKTQEYRGETFMIAHGLLVKSGMVNKPMLDKAVVQVEFYHKTSRLQDSDNIIASLKAAIDGLTSAGILNDDNNLTWLPVKRMVAKEHERKPGVILTITQVESKADILSLIENQLT